MGARDSAGLGDVGARCGGAARRSRRAADVVVGALAVGLAALAATSCGPAEGDGMEPLTPVVSPRRDSVATAVVPARTGQSSGDKLGAALAFCRDGRLVVGASGSGGSQPSLHWTTAVGSVAEFDDSSLTELGFGVALTELSCGRDVVGVGYDATPSASPSYGALLLDMGLGTAHWQDVPGLPGEVTTESPSLAVLPPARGGLKERAALWTPGTQGLRHLRLHRSDGGLDAIVDEFSEGLTGARLVRSGDLDGDGFEDLAVGWSVAPAAPNLRVYRGLADGGFVYAVAEMSVGPCFGGPCTLAALAVERGVTDADHLAVIVQDGPLYRLYAYGLSADGPSLKTETILPQAPGGGLALGDWDGDGLLDLFVGFPGENALWMARVRPLNDRGSGFELVDAGWLTPCSLAGAPPFPCDAGAPLNSSTARFGAALDLSPPVGAAGTEWRLAIGAPDWSASQIGDAIGAVFVVSPSDLNAGGGADGGGLDAGVSDAGRPDAGVSDAGTGGDGGARDSGTPDGGETVDAGAADPSADAGSTECGGPGTSLCSGANNYRFAATGCSSAPAGLNLGAFAFLALAGLLAAPGRHRARRAAECRARAR